MHAFDEQTQPHMKEKNNYDTSSEASIELSAAAFPDSTPTSAAGGDGASGIGSDPLKKSLDSLLHTQRKFK